MLDLLRQYVISDVPNVITLIGATDNDNCPNTFFFICTIFLFKVEKNHRIMVDWN